jgi:DNA polymerase-4
MPSLCRDCLTLTDAHLRSRCPACRSPRMVAHGELATLSIAHMDCDAFYASVEKRDNPALRDQAVIVGGGQRGVVSTCCYIARIKGVRSAMPMFQALKLCPEAVVVKPRFSAYTEASRAIRAMMEDLTPSIEPLSLDEAFLDLTGTARLHGAPPPSCWLA